jgi:hypothetical protein
VESDPLGQSAGVNTYAYAMSNPLAVMDPWGLLEWRNSALYEFDYVAAWPSSRIQEPAPTEDENRQVE